MKTRSCLVIITVALLVAAVAPGLTQTPPAARKTNQVNPEAVEMLRKLLDQQKSQPDRILRVPATYTNAPIPNPAPASAKPVKARAKEPTPPAKANIESGAPKASKEPVPSITSKPAAVPSPAPVPTAEQKMVSDVEQGINDLMRQKEARDKASQAGGNTKTNTVPAGPLTKRQKLDALLKDYIDGKVTEADYHARRAKLVSEPD